MSKVEEGRLCPRWRGRAISNLDKEGYVQVGGGEGYVQSGGEDYVHVGGRGEGEAMSGMEREYYVR